MRKKRVLLSIAILFVAIVVAVCVVGVLLKQKPDFYTREMANSGTPDDQSLAINTVNRISDLQAAMFRDPDLASTGSWTWGATFTAEDVNALLRENRTRQSDLSAKLFGELDDPRVAIEDDRLRIAFRYGEGFWSTIVSVEMRMWLVTDEADTIAIEITGLSAGSLPLNKQWPLDQITEVLRSQHVDVKWYRNKGNKGNPVGICQLFVNRTQRDTHLLGLKLADGRFTVAGRHTDASAVP